MKMGTYHWLILLKIAVCPPVFRSVSGFPLTSLVVLNIHRLRGPTYLLKQKNWKLLAFYGCFTEGGRNVSRNLTMEVPCFILVDCGHYFSSDHYCEFQFK